MDYTVFKQFSSQFLILDAKNPDEAIEKVQKGEGERTQSGQNWQAVAMKPQQQPQPAGAPGGPVAVTGPRKP